MTIHSLNKGKNGEREVAKLFTEAGFPARRGQQYEGSSESPDVVCEGLPWLHIESKRVERGNLYNWLEQSQRDAGTRTPIVAHRRSNKEWVIVTYLQDYLELLKKVA